MSTLAPVSAPTPALGGPALRAFFAVAHAWRLTEADQRAVLGHPSAAQWSQWQTEGATEVDEVALVRISHVLAIYRALHTLFPQAAQADAWLQRPNQAPGFAGRSAAQRLGSGELSDLVAVRRHLDAQVNG